MAEPPAKRLRILQSVDVDESNPEYRAEKENQRLWLKNKFEAIFAKYEAVPEAMSDEIDMRGDGRIVVDRGHMKKLDKEYRKRMGRRAVRSEDVQPLDDLFVDEPGMDSDDSGLGEEERDELAPSESPKPKTRTPPKTSENAARNRLPTLQPNQLEIATLSSPATVTLPISMTSPAADLAQLAHFPQTPAGQQAQTAFIAQTAQVIQQAAMSIFSNFLSTARQVEFLPTPETPLINHGDIGIPRQICSAVEPASTPKLQIPLPTDQNTRTEAGAQLEEVNPRKRARRSLATGVFITPSRRAHVPEEASETTDNANPQPADEQSENANEMIKAQETQRSVQRSGRRKYNFTEEDDQYIIAARRAGQLTWEEIIKSRTEWKSWPVSTFHQRWHKLRNERPSEIGDLPTTRPRKPNAKPKIGHQPSTDVDVQNRSSSLAMHHLPTPSSSVQQEDQQYDGADNTNASDDIEEIITSGGHYDDDDKDLLSLNGSDDVTEMSISEDRTVLETAENTPEPRNDVLPSVEAETPWKKQRHTKIINPAVGKEVIEEEQALAYNNDELTSPSQIDLPEDHNDVGSDIDLDFVQLETPKSKLQPQHQCPLCKQLFNTKAILQRHQTEPHPKEIRVRTSTLSSSISQTPAMTNDDDDELLAPATPYIKRESVTPARNLLLTTAVLKTPKSAPQPTNLHSSGASSVSKARSVFLQKVKKSWASSASKPSPAGKSAVKTKSLVQVSRKRAWEGDSEDELGL